MTPQPGRWPTAAEAHSLAALRVRCGSARSSWPAHLGAGHGAVARERGRPGHAKRARLVRTIRARPAGRDRGRGHGDSRCGERALAADRRGALHRRASNGWSRPCGRRAQARRGCSFSSSIFCPFAGGPNRANSSRGSWRSPRASARARYDGAAGCARCARGLPRWMRASSRAC